MLYVMPASAWDKYKSGGQYRLLRDAADAISARYPTTTVKPDRLVVRVLYKSFHIEVQPVFRLEDGTFRYPDSYGEGTWKITKPLSEMAAMSEFDKQKNKNLRRLCKMTRSWKNKHGVGMGGLLVDTLAHNFLSSTATYDTKSYLYYDLMVRDFFTYLSSLPVQKHFAALGSGQHVKVKSNFQRKAKNASDLCQRAIDAKGNNNQYLKWKKIFGKSFPATHITDEQADAIRTSTARNTEEFFDSKFTYDVRHAIRIDCRVTMNGFPPFLLKESLRKRLRLKAKRTLEFHISKHTIPGNFDLHWKVLNRGEEAIARDCIRGQLEGDRGRLRKQEHSNFSGDHLVECVAVQNGVVVATDRILVPIE